MYYGIQPLESEFESQIQSMLLINVPISYPDPSRDYTLKG